MLYRSIHRTPATARIRMLPPLLAILRRAFLGLLGSVALCAHAGSFQVNPVRVDLGASATSAAITVRNDGAAAVVVQTAILAWSQADGKDEYTPADGALATPPLATIPPSGEQIVRVGLRRAPDPRTELAFRLYVQEIPGSERPSFSGLQVALRVGIPVFVAPSGPVTRKLEWTAKRQADGRLALTVENRGNVHLQI